MKFDHADWAYYRIYGLSIRSHVRLSQLSAVEPVKHDLTICYGQDGLRPIGAMSGAVSGERVTVRTSPTEIVVFHAEVGEFHIKGDHVICFPHPKVQLEVIENFLLGPILSLVLQRQSLLVLHGSAVLKGRRVAGFVGMSGQGKSTLAAALVSRGYTLVSDDLLVVEQDAGGRHTIRAGPGYVRLYPGWVQTLTAKHCLQVPAGSVRPPASTKAAYPCASDTSHEDTPLTSIFVLATGHSMRLTTLSTAAAVVELVRYTYYARILRSLDFRQHFSQCANIARCSKVVRLERPRDVAAVPAMLDSIESHFASA